MRYLMGIDNGGTYAKAALFDEKGRQIAVSSRLVSNEHPKPGYSERDMSKLWEANREAIREILRKSGASPSQIAGISFSGHGKGLYLLNSDGTPSRNGILSTDNRAFEYVEKWNRNGTAQRVREKTLQPILACQPVSLLRWLKDNEPEVYEQSSMVLSVNDYIRYCLTGEAYGEITTFSGGNLLNMETGTYDKELMALFGIEEAFDKLMPLKAPAELCGVVTKSAAEETGLMEGTPVSAGMFDIDACGIASGLSDGDKMCMIAGTWSINEFIAREPVLNSPTSLNSIFCIPGYYLIEESSPTSAGNLEWFIENLLLFEKEEMKQKNKSVYDLINKWVESIPPEEPLPIFLPFLSGSDESPIARGTLVGLTSYHKKKHMIRAVFEGVVFSHLTHVKRLLLNHEVPKSISLTGGAANSRTWAQMFADALQIPVDVIEGKEMGALGAAIAAGVAIGVYKDYAEAIENMVHISCTLQPRREYGEVYEKKFLNYRRVNDALSVVWQHL